MNDKEISEILLENRKMRKALGKIAKWHDEFPKAYTRDGQICSFESAHGSNGARDYMREIAAEALSL
jgi:hypothetical protein